MNYQASLERLNKEKEALEKKLKEDESPLGSLSGSKETLKDKLELVEAVIKGYSRSLAQEASSGKIEEAFSKIHGFTKQKEEVKSLLLLQKYFKAEGIKVQEKKKSLCLVGPPGVGKTHFAYWLAEALGRKLHKVSLGGASSSVIITGGQGVWKGSEPGSIINAIIKTESCDPVILLDEVEKTGKDPHHGAIEDALLHVLDPEQTSSFTDQYLGVEIDISRITFVLTANELDKISGPLKDRLEIVKLGAYNEAEKLAVGKLEIEKIFRENYENKNRELFEMSDPALVLLISKTKEEGVRKLESKLEKIIRRCFVQWAQQLENGQEKERIVYDEDKVNEFLAEDSEEEKDSREDQLGKKIDQLDEVNKKLKSDLEEEQKKRQKLENKHRHSQPWGSVGLPWAIGGGIVLALFGVWGGWFLTKEFKKKKKTVQLSSTPKNQAIRLDSKGK